MPLPRAITVLMKADVIVKTKTNEDGYGKKVLSSGTPCKAYVDYNQRRVWTDQGEWLNSAVQAYLAVDFPTLTTEGEVTLPDGTKPPIRGVRRPAWPDGSRHTEVFF